ncbi:hypothetical protein Q0601_20735 [Paracoccus onubensis]|nr:hypothetical protein [Paracoccus onubensis]MDP0929618.1 hypothetical protein [Paracoccus onubensis]
MQKTLLRGGGGELAERLQATMLQMGKPGLANDIRKALARDESEPARAVS